MRITYSVELIGDEQSQKRDHRRIRPQFIAEKGDNQCDFRHAMRKQVKGSEGLSSMVWFAKTLADFEINDIAALPPLFCYNS